MYMQQLQKSVIDCKTTPREKYRENRKIEASEASMRDLCQSK